MDELERQCFTVGVFADVEGAQRGIEALGRKGFATESLSMIIKETPEAADLVRRTFGVDATTIDLRRVGTVVAHGPLVGALQGSERDLDR